MQSNTPDGKPKDLFPKEYDPDSSEFKAKGYDKEILRMLVKKCKKTGKRPNPNDYYHLAEVSEIKSRREAKELLKEMALSLIHI